ncbi:MAG: hypoxanthine phosphoribosyltransferase [Planctomycetota bacterium]
MNADDIDRVLLDADSLRHRVADLAAEIDRSFAGEEILAVGVLNGAFVFLADLVRALASPVQVAFLRAASYGGGTRPGELSVEAVGEVDLEGKNVLIVEDILDTGRSLLGIRAAIEAARPKRLEIVVLLDKAERREVNVAADHIGFAVPDEFLVGYGLDYAGRYRNLPYVGVLSRTVYGG